MRVAHTTWRSQASMFASVWQLLTAIFFFSALTKLLYKLIKEDNNSHHNHHLNRPGQLLGAATTRRQIVIVRARAEVEADEQQQRQLEEEEEEVRTDEHDEDQDQSTQEEELDEDEEFEETLSQGFQSYEQRQGEERARRQRWLARQQFRRQLNRLGTSASNEDAEALQLSPTSSGEYFDANSFASQSPSVSSSLTSNSQNALQQQVAQDEERAQQQHQVSVLLGHHDDGIHMQSNAATGHEHDKPSLSDSRSSNLITFRNSSNKTSTTTKTKTQTNQNDAPTQNYSPAAAQFDSSVVSHLTKLIGEIFLLEPLKLTCSIVSQTLKTFCAFLDFIEGIDSSTTPDSDSGSPSSLFVRQVNSHRAHRGANSQQQQQEQPQKANKRRSNYFHRRYFSRRSLSAALLSDDDDQQGDNQPSTRQQLREASHL